MIILYVNCYEWLLDKKSTQSKVKVRFTANSYCYYYTIILYILTSLTSTTVVRSRSNQ